MFRMFRGLWRTALFLSIMGICSGAGAEAIEVDLDIGLHGGYRADELDWTIAGNDGGTNPDILSELAWKDLDIFQVGSTGKIIAGRPGKVLFAEGRALLDYGWIVDGKNRDSDFSGDGRTLEWSRSINDAGEGEVYDLSIGGGPGLRLLSGRLSAVTLVGFSYNRQNLTLRDGFQVLSDPDSSPAGITPPPIGPIIGLDSTYEAEWIGPWAGIDLCWSPLDRLTLYGGFEYHWADYEADARWNLRTDLAQPVSFTHEADGRGTVFDVGLDFEPAAAWTVGFEARFQNWETGRGIDRTFFSDGSTATTRLNEVKWKSAAWMVAVSHRFF